MTTFVKSKAAAGMLLNDHHTSWCYQCKAYRPLYPFPVCVDEEQCTQQHEDEMPMQRRPLQNIKAVCAGSSCQDFAMHGLRWCFIGDNMEEWLLFVEEMKILKPDVVWLEITSSCPPDLHQQLADSLGEHSLGGIGTYKMVTGIDNPKSRGIPVRRQRRHTFIYNTKTFDFTGSYSEYDQVLARAPVLTGKAYVQMNAADRQKYMREMAANKRIHFSSSVDLQMKDFLTIPQAKRLEHHEKEFYSENYCWDAYLTDLNQQPSFTTGDQYMPCITTNCKLIA
eukprot:4615341-Pyramimonas_sp.AAC.1